MLTFRKGGYNEAELQALYDALTYACCSLRCEENGCDGCAKRKPFEDITRCREHVLSVLNDIKNQTH